MEEVDRWRLSLVGTAIGGLTVVLGAVALAATSVFAVGYLLLRDVDLDFAFPELELDGLSPTSAEWVGALDVATGERRWVRDFGVGSEPVGVSGELLVLRRPGSLIAIDAATGEGRWQHDVGPSVREAGLANGEVVYVDGGALVAIDATSGTERWRAADAAIFGDLLATGGEVAVVMTPGGEARAVDTATGATRWTTPVGGAASARAGAVLGDLVVLRIDLAAVALDTSTGAVRWTWSLPTTPGGALPGGLSYLDPPIGAGPTVGIQIFDSPSTTGTVFLDALTGVERWRTASGALSSFSYDPGATAGGTLFENGQGGRLRARDPLTGAVRFEVEMMSGAVLAVGSSVFVSNGAAVALDSSTGAPRWSRGLGVDRDATPLGVEGGVLVLAGDQV